MRKRGGGGGVGGEGVQAVSVWAGGTKKPEMMRKVGMEEVRRWRCVKERKGFIMGEVWGAPDDEG